MKLWDKKFIFVGGKGGVGKSTCAAALALSLARAGRQTLLISTDPAHNIGHIFSKEIGGKVSKIDSCLYSIEIDPKREGARYIKSVKETMKGVVQATMMEEVHRQLDAASASPGADEAALFDKLIAIMLEEGQAYDHVVFDTAPTGHTIRLLSLPELMGVWIEGLLERRKKTKANYSRLLNDGEPIEDPIYEVLGARQVRFRKARKLMLDYSKTGFIFVLNPERLPIVETKEAIQILAQYDLHVDTLVVNRVLPEADGGEFFKKRKEMEAVYLQTIEEEFQNQTLYYIPFFANDILSTKDLEVFSSYFHSNAQ